MKVYVLTAEVNDLGAGHMQDYEVTGEYSGITSVHATVGGALAAFNEWLDKVGIDRSAAHYGRTETPTFVGNDPDPETLDGDLLQWGINTHEVNA